MPSPVKPSDVDSLIPTPGTSVCDGLKAALFSIPGLYRDFLAWMLNSDGTVSDAFKDEIRELPPGVVQAYAGSSIPDGWIFCNGQSISRTTYADLFNAIGTLYGAGDGSTTFNVPNLMGRVVAGQSTTDSDFDLADAGGEKEHTLTEAELASHTHTGLAYSRGDGGPEATDPSGVNNDLVHEGGGHTNDSVSQFYAFGVLTDPTGSDSGHNNLQPYLALKYIIRT